jgi:hypothetical protein
MRYNEKVRLNLILTVALIFLIAVASLVTAKPTNLLWKQACADGVSFTIRSGGNYCQWLEVENDRYRFCDQCSTSTEVRERGFVELQGENLTLVSDQGKRAEYRVTEGAGRWFLSDAQGKAHGQEMESLPRLHPSPEWLDNSKPLELDAPSTPHVVEISELEPVVPEPEKSLFPEIEIARLNSDLSGSRLFQGGRDLLNTRSTRRDVESLFGPLKWKILEGPTTHGTTAQAQIGKLLIRVSGIVGNTPDEARVIGFSLQDT